MTWGYPKRPRNPQAEFRRRPPAERSMPWRFTPPGLDREAVLAALKVLDVAGCPASACLTPYRWTLPACRTEFTGRELVRFANEYLGHTGLPEIEMSEAVNV